MTISNQGNKVVLKGLRKYRQYGGYEQDEYDGYGLIPIVYSHDGVSITIGEIEMYLIGGIGLYVKTLNSDADSFELGGISFPGWDTGLGWDLFRNLKFRVDASKLEVYNQTSAFGAVSVFSPDELYQSKDYDEDAGIYRTVQNGDYSYLNRYEVSFDWKSIDQRVIRTDLGQIWVARGGNTVGSDGAIYDAAGECNSWMDVSFSSIGCPVVRDGAMVYFMKDGLLDSRGKSYVCARDFVAYPGIGAGHGFFQLAN